MGLNFYHTAGFSVGYGFDSIAVALLGAPIRSASSPRRCCSARWRAGASRMQFLSQIPIDIIKLIQALVLIFVAAPALIRWLYRIRVPREADAVAGDVQLGSMLGQGRNVSAAAPAIERSGGRGIPRVWMQVGLWVALALILIVATGLRFGEAVVISILAVTITKATPLTLGALAGICSERIGRGQHRHRGHDADAAFVGFMTGVYTQNLALALIAALAGGALMALLHAVLSITFRVDQIISGTVINILAVGLTGFLNRQLFATGAPPGLSVLPKVDIPLLSDLPWVGPIIFQQKPIALIAILLVFILHFALFRTRWGLRTRAVGEHPLAADTVGVNVNGLRYLNVVLGGVIAGLAGAYFTLESVPHFEPLMTNGRGFIALAAMIFGKWTPFGAWGAALLFGVAEAIPTALQIQGINIPFQIVGLLPYVLTIVVVAGAVGRATPPAADRHPVCPKG